MSGAATHDPHGTQIGAVLAELSKLRNDLSRLTDVVERVETAVNSGKAPAYLLRPPEAGTHGAYRAKVIEVLKAACPERLTAAEVADRVSQLLPARVHPKTPGMTLTRLKREGLVGRDRRTWYWLLPPVE